jgi:RNA polymerase sigma-70 factor (ECF subfamily)
MEIAELSVKKHHVLPTISSDCSPEAGPAMTEPAPRRTFEEIYRNHGQRVLNLAFKFVKQEDVARDMTQDVFMKVYEHLDTFRDESDIATWIHRIALNHLMNYLKRERRYSWFALMEENVADAFHSNRTASMAIHQSDDPTPHTMLETSEREQILSEAVESLPPKYRVPFLLQRDEGMSQREIAAALDISVSAVEARIHRAKKKLIDKLEPWLDHI